MIRGVICGLVLFLVSTVGWTCCPSGMVTKVLVEQETKDPIVLSVNGNEVSIKNLIVGDCVEVYDVLGVKISTVRIDTPSRLVKIKLPKGYYIFKIRNMVRKVVVR